MLASTQLKSRLWSARAELTSGFLAIMVYLNTANYGFVYDDRKAILSNPSVVGDLELSTLVSTDFWGVPLNHPGSHKSFRPLTTLSFRFDWLINPNSFQFHITNIILHGIATGLVVRFCKILVSLNTAWLAGLIFAVHPVHTEAVAGIVGRAEILSSIFYLSCLIHHHKNGWSVYTAILAGVAMLAKEQGITVLPVCVVMDVLSKQDAKTVRRSLLKIMLTAVCLISLRSLALKGGFPSFSASDNPAAKSDCLVTRTLTFAYLAVLNLFLLISPATLSYDWSMSAVPLVKSFCDVRNVATLITFSTIGYLSIKIYKSIHSRLINIVITYDTKKYSFRCENNNIILSDKIQEEKIETKPDIIRVVGVSLSVLILAYLPASNLVVYVGFVLAERVLYLPSIGYSLLLAFAIQQFTYRYQKKRNLIKIATLLLLTTFSVRTVLRNQVWRNEETLFRSGVSINPAKSWSNYANILSSTRGNKIDAELAFKQALMHRFNMADTHYNLGILLQEQQRYKEAVIFYKQAIRFRPGLGFAYLNLGLTLTELGDSKGAVTVFRKGVDVTDKGIKDPADNIEARAASSLNLGRLLLEHGDRNGALAVLHQAVNKTSLTYTKATFLQNHGETGSGIREKLYNQLGEVYTSLGNTHEAEKWYQSSLTVNPRHVPAYLTLAKLIAKNNSRIEEAETIFKRAVSLNPSSSSTNAHYGLFLLDRHRYQEAAVRFESAVLHDPGSYDYVFNLAVASRLAGQLQLAEKSYRRAVELRPGDPEPHLNLGAMLHLRGNLQQAEAEYLEAWRLQPGQHNVRVNLERLHNIMRKKGMEIRDIDGE